MRVLMKSGVIKKPRGVKSKMPPNGRLKKLLMLMNKGLGPFVKKRKRV
jgi:hypothetical protein